MVRKFLRFSCILILIFTKALASKTILAFHRELKFDRKRICFLNLRWLNCFPSLLAFLVVLYVLFLCSIVNWGHYHEWIWFLIETSWFPLYFQLSISELIGLNFSESTIASICGVRCYDSLDCFRIGYYWALRHRTLCFVIFSWWS